MPENYNRIFDELFQDVPVGSSTWVHWKRQNPEHLEGAARVIVEHGANPWVFAADERHFDEFAGDEDRRAMTLMDKWQRAALLDWD